MLEAMPHRAWALPAAGCNGRVRHRTAMPAENGESLFVGRDPMSPETVMATFSRKFRSEEQAFVEETYPFPVVACSLAVLFLGNIAVTLAAVSALA
jgi:hypothetical protein